MNRTQARASEATPAGMRRAARLGASAVLLLAMMFLGSLGLWLGIPIGWLWIASKVEAATGSLAAAVALAFLAAPASILVLMRVLAWLSEGYRRQRVARGLEDTGDFVLEVVVVTSAAMAVGACAIWFILSGAAPFGIPQP